MRMQEQPNIVLRSLWAGTLVSFLAGPVFQWLLIASGDPVADSEFPVRAGDVGVFLYLFPLVSVVGLVGALPAAIINAIAVAALAKRRIDGALPAIVSAAICGAVIPSIALRLFGSETRNLIGGEHTSAAISCLALTGALMGFVYWMIAVRPHQQWLQSNERS